MKWYKVQSFVLHVNVWLMPRMLACTYAVQATGYWLLATSVINNKDFQKIPHSTLKKKNIGVLKREKGDLLRSLNYNIFNNFPVSYWPWELHNCSTTSSSY